MIKRQLMTLKISVKVTEYDVHNGLIPCQISISIKVVRKHFSPALTVLVIFTSQISLLWKCRLRSWCTKIAGDIIRWQIHEFLSDDNSNDCSRIVYGRQLWNDSELPWQQFRWRYKQSFIENTIQFLLNTLWYNVRYWVGI